MAHNKSSRKCEGLCQKIHNAVSPFRSTIRRISHQPQGSKTITSVQNPPPQTAENPVRISSPQIKPVHVLHQPSLNKMIPVEFEDFSAQENKPVQEFADREILIVRGQKFAKSASRKQEVAPPKKVEKLAPAEDKPPNHVQFAKARSKKDDDDLMHEAKFSDYISKVKNRMMKTASNAGGDSCGGTSPRRDSFNDKVTNYINHAKIKIRTTTNIGDQSLSFK